MMLQAMASLMSVSMLLFFSFFSLSAYKYAA